MSWIVELVTRYVCLFLYGSASVRHNAKRLRRFKRTFFVKHLYIHDDVQYFLYDLVYMYLEFVKSVYKRVVIPDTRNTVGVGASSRLNCKFTLS